MIKMTEETYNEMLEDNCGMCINCHNERDGIEPDAREYHCGECNSEGVYGLKELLLMGELTFIEGDEYKESVMDDYDKFSLKQRGI